MKTFTHFHKQGNLYTGNGALLLMHFSIIFKPSCWKKESCFSNNSSKSLLTTAQGVVYIVYFDQQMGALHAVYWSKSYVSALKHLFSSQTEKRKKKGKRQKINNYC